MGCRHQAHRRKGRLIVERDRPEASQRFGKNLPKSELSDPAASPCRQGCHPAPGEMPAWLDGDSPSSFRRSPVGHRREHGSWKWSDTTSLWFCFTPAGDLAKMQNKPKTLAAIGSATNQ